MRIYDDLTEWYRLLDPPGDHADEAAVYTRALVEAAVSPAETLLELGAGAGHNALFMKRHFRCMLTDLSPRMLDLSRALNPDCEHEQADMRSLRLGREFDAVFIHDAVCYMTTADDLRRVAETAFIHTKPGGAALFAPDYVRERFAERAGLLSADEGSRSLRGLEWAWDPDPADTRYRVDYSFLLRDGLNVTTATDVHDEGLFPTATWIHTLEAAGYLVETIDRPLGDEVETDRVFVCRRPITPR
jgi:SAM-dependent methyltransferase